ncbi:GNAT family N-acetyltransferase [Nanoarchaeota archaeon]
MIKVEKIRGKDLSLNFIRLWRKTTIKTFKEDNPLSLTDRREYARDIFFIVKDGGKIVSFGRSRPIKINFLGKNYDILGWGDVISLKKRKGYGKVLMKAMKEYAEKRNKTAFGFFHPKNYLFYKSCGFVIIKNIVRRFTYIDKKKGLIRNTWDKHINYVEGKDKFIHKLLSTKKDVLLSGPFW